MDLLSLQRGRRRGEGLAAGAGLGLCSPGQAGPAWINICNSSDKNLGQRPGFFAQAKCPGKQAGVRQSTEAGFRLFTQEMISESLTRRNVQHYTTAWARLLDFLFSL